MSCFVAKGSRLALLSPVVTIGAISLTSAIVSRCSFSLIVIGISGSWC
jgi:hypothetical protein